MLSFIWNATQGGYMLKSVYDKDDNGRVDNADYDNSESGLEADNTKDAIDEIVVEFGKVAYLEGDNTFTGQITFENGILKIKETTTPSSDEGYGKVYTKIDNRLYFQDGAGVEHDILSSSKTVQIWTIDDFPEPVSGVITLENFSYMINADIETELKFKAPVSGWCSLESAGNNFVLEYTGSDAMFKDPEMTGNLVLNLIQLSAPNGKLFDIVGNGSNEILMIDSTVVDVSEIGTIKDSSSSILFGLFLDWGQGLILDGGLIYVSESAIADGKNEVSGVMITTQGTIDSLVLSNNRFTTNGANERILDLKSTGTYTNSNINVNGFNISAGGLIFASGSLDHSELVFVGNSGSSIENSTVACDARLEGNTEQTIIPAEDAWVLLKASTWDDSKSSVHTERGVLGADGVFTHTGIENVNLILDGNIAPDPATATKTIASRFINFHSHELFVVTFTNGTNIVNEIDTPLENGDTIIFYDSVGTLPTGLRKDVIYFIVNKNVDDFQLAYTAGGLPIAFPDNGVPVNLYAITDLLGSTPKQIISSGSPRDLVPQAAVKLETGDKTGPFLQNKTDTVSLNCGDAYSRIAKS